jgi:hypothetical protein
VLAFVSDGPRAAAEMASVVRRSGVVAACMFESNGLALTRLFWEAARRFDPAAPDDARLPYRTEEALAALRRSSDARGRRSAGSRGNRPTGGTACRAAARSLVTRRLQRAVT